MSSILVTGGAGFIGSNFVRDQVINQQQTVVNVDKLTYAGNLQNLDVLDGDVRHIFVHADMGNRQQMDELLAQHQPSAVINFAAESHVDRSIHGPADFIQTNIVSTFHLLESVRFYYDSAVPEQQADFRFLHVSTDEVYGSLTEAAPAFTESTPYAPNSPYSASKAASDHLVRAYHHTYGLPVLTTNCSNNYGPYQFPEKLIPLIIVKALKGEDLPIYGDGMNIRDWLYVQDHCTAIAEVLARGRLGEVYNIGGDQEKTNVDIVQTVCAILDERVPADSGHGYAEQITFVKDRVGHDRRYAINARKIQQELGWVPSETFESGIRKTVEWYLANPEWVQNVLSGQYQQWLDTNYGSNHV